MEIPRGRGREGGRTGGWGGVLNIMVLITVIRGEVEGAGRRGGESFHNIKQRVWWRCRGGGHGGGGCRGRGKGVECSINI